MTWFLSCATNYDFIENKNIFKDKEIIDKSPSKYFPYFHSGSRAMASKHYLGEITLYDSVLTIEASESGTGEKMPDLKPFQIRLSNIAEWDMAVGRAISLFIKDEKYIYLFLIKANENTLSKYKRTLIKFIKETNH